MVVWQGNSRHAGHHGGEASCRGFFHWALAGAAIECGQTKGPMITPEKVSHKKKWHTQKKEHRRSQQDVHNILSQAHIQDLDALAMKNERKAKEVRRALCASNPGLNTYRKNPSVWTHCLVIQTNAWNSIKQQLHQPIEKTSIPSVFHFPLPRSMHSLVNAATGPPRVVPGCRVSAELPFLGSLKGFNMI